MGGIDTVVASAGVGSPPQASGSIRQLVDLDIEGFDLVMDVNLRGVFLTCQRAAQLMIAAGHGGAMVTLASMASKRPTAGVYSISKAAVWMLTRCLAHELGQHGIRVNAIGPGYVDTALFQSMVLAAAGDDPEAQHRWREARRSQVALGRFGTPEDVARTALFLCSDDAELLHRIAVAPRRRLHLDLRRRLTAVGEPMQFDIGRYAAAVFDLDGTVWLSDTPMPGAVEFLDGCRAAGLSITFATNATAIAVDRLTELLVACRLARPGDGVVTGASVVARSLPRLGVRQVVAEVPPAMQAAIEAQGVEVLTTDGVHTPAGWDTPLLGPGGGDRSLAGCDVRQGRAGRAARQGRAPALRRPRSTPASRPPVGSSPAAGCWSPPCAPSTTSTPTVMAKPSIQYAEAIREAAGSDGPFVMFGDSQRADIGTARLLGADGVLISVTGAIDRADLPRPHYITPGLHAPIIDFEDLP